MMKNGFIEDFLKNGPWDLPNFGNLDAPNILFHILEVSRSGKIWIWSYGVIIDDSGMFRVLDHQDFLKNGSSDFSDFLHVVRGHCSTFF